MPFFLAFLLICALAGPLFGQQRIFNWLPANDESVRLDPANYHTGGLTARIRQGPTIMWISRRRSR